MDFIREINISLSLSTKDALHRKRFNLDTSTDFLWPSFYMAIVYAEVKLSVIPQLRNCSSKEDIIRIILNL